MTNTIYIIMLVMIVISGLLAVSPNVKSGKAKEKDDTVIGKLGLQTAVDMKKHLYSKVIALVVFILSLASLMAMYFIKG